MKKITTLLFIIGILGLSLNTVSAQKQKGRIRYGNALFEMFDYENAIKVYNKVLDKNPSNTGVLPNLGTALRLTGKNPEAISVYKKIVAIPGVEPLKILEYAQILSANGNHKEAIKQYKKYAKIQNLVIPPEKLNDFLVPDPDVTVSNVRTLNTPACDFGPAYVPATDEEKGEKELVFVSNRGKKGLRDLWTRQPYLQLYKAEKTGNTGFGGISKLLAKNIFDLYHEGPVAFDDNGTVMYITRDNYLKRRPKVSKDQVVKLKIYKLTFDEKRGGWGNIEEGVPFNNNEYSVASPSISKDGKYMFFHSDMPGGEGGTDIYVSEKFDGSWSSPVNLGKAVNTPGDEEFPFIAEDGTLFFSSDGHVGLGGLDIFSSTKKGEEWAVPQNLGSPINSNRDDFGFITNTPKHNTGYLASNRKGGVGCDDIYSFEKKRIVLTACATDAESGELLEGATVKILDASGKVISESNDAGCITTDAEDGSYKTMASKEGLLPKEELVTIQGESKKVDLPLAKNPTLTACVIDGETNEPLEGASLKILSNGRVVEELVTDATGCYTLVSEPNVSYTIEGDKVEYTPNSTSAFVKEASVKANVVVGKTPPINLCVTVYEKKGDSRYPLSDATVEFIDMKSGDAKKMTTDGSGKICYTVGPEICYKFIGTKISSNSNSKYLQTDKVKCTYGAQPGDVINEELELLYAEEGTEIRIENIYFDLNKDNIRPDAAAELDKTVKVLRDNPTIEVEMGSHTDCRASRRYNEDLSERRARSSMNYLISQGIDASRLSSRGYGETQLTNGCACEGKVKVPCTEEQHQQNRRTVFKIVKL